MTGIATGRSLYGVVPEIRDLNPDYFVTINGAYVVDKKEAEIVSDPLPRDLVENMSTGLSQKVLSTALLVRINQPCQNVVT